MFYLSLIFPPLIQMLWAFCPHFLLHLLRHLKTFTRYLKHHWENQWTLTCKLEDFGEIDLLNDLKVIPDFSPIFLDETKKNRFPRFKVSVQTVKKGNEKFEKESSEKKNSFRQPDWWQFWVQLFWSTHNVRTGTSLRRTTSVIKWKAKHRRHKNITLLKSFFATSGQIGSKNFRLQSLSLRNNKKIRGARSRESNVNYLFLKERVRWTLLP